MTMTLTHPDPFVAAILRDMAPTFIEPEPPTPAAAGGRHMAMSLVFDTPDELAAWTGSRHDPAWKHKPIHLGKLALKKPLKSELEADAKQYEYRVNFDYRKHTTPAATLEEFIARNHDPKWKPKPLPKPRGVKSLSAKARAAEERRVSAYVASRRAA